MQRDFTGDVTVNGVRLHALAEGRADLPTVVLINSLATDLRIWDAQMAALLQHYRVVRYDARGHGRSAAPRGPYTMDMLTDDLFGLLAHFGVAQALVVGVSLGGLTAMAAALRRPAAIAGIVACDCRADMPPEFVEGIAARNTLVRAQGTAAIADTMVERWFTAATLAAKPAVLDRIRQMIRDTSVEGFTGCAEAIRDSGMRPRVRDIAVPALFVVGDADAALPVALMQAMQREVAGARIEIIAGAGHLPNVEQPSAFNAAVAAFLDRHAG